MPLLGNLKRPNPIARSNLDIPDQNKKLKLLNEGSLEKVPRETKRNEPETENSGCAVHPKDEDENYESPCKLAPDLELQITQPISRDRRVPDDEEKKSKLMAFGKSLMKGFQKGIKRKKPAIAKSKSHDCICREDEDEENLEPPSVKSTPMTKDFTRAEMNERITRPKSLTSVLSEKKDDESKTLKSKFMKGLQTVIKRKKPAKTKSQSCLEEEDENDEKNFKMLSKIKKKNCGKSQSYDSTAGYNNEEQKSKMPFRTLVEHFPVRVKRKKPVLRKSKSYDDFIDEDKNRQKYKKKEERQPLRELFWTGKKRNELLPELLPVQPSTTSAQIHQVKSKDRANVLPENEDEEKESILAFPGLTPMQPSTTRAQIHQVKSKDPASVLSENKDEEKESILPIPGLTPMQSSTTRAQIHQMNSKDHASVLPGNEDDEKEPKEKFPGISPMQLSNTDAQILNQAKSKDHTSVLPGKEDEEKESMVSFYEFSEEPICFGAAGTCVYSGVNTKDSRKVAIKKINCHTKKQSSKYKREIEYLLRLRHCPNVVNYLDVEVRKDVVYIMLELMEGTLETLVNKPNPEVNFVELSHDIITALQFLHKIEIIHRDIKPRNILFTSVPRIMLKLADFGLSKMIGSESSTYNGGTRCWMAPEVHRSLDQFSTASDVFASGLVLYYLMTSMHLFAPKDVKCSKESRLLVEHKTVDNILNQKLNPERRLSPEALHLIKQMVNHDKQQRPSANEVLAHPFFWPSMRKITFLEATANQSEIFKKGASDFKKDLESTQLGAQFQIVPWSEQSPTMACVYNEMMVAGRRKYDTTSVAELLRFVRNAHQHVSEPGRTSLFREYLLKDYVFLKEFRPLFIDVYETVRKHEWHKNRIEIKCAIP